MGPDIRGPDSDFCRVVRGRRGGVRRRRDGLVVGGEGLDVRSIGQKMEEQKNVGAEKFFVRWWIRTADEHSSDVDRENQVECLNK